MTIFAETPRNEAYLRIEESVRKIEDYLQRLGYVLLPIGVPIALTELLEGRSEAEVASHIAYTTLARDIGEANGGEERAAHVSHGHGMLKMLEQFRDQQLMDLSHWTNDTDAVSGIVDKDEVQQQSVKRILNDPIARTGRIARRQPDQAT